MSGHSMERPDIGADWIICLTQIALGLEVKHFSIAPVLGHELVVGAHFNDLPLL